MSQQQFTHFHNTNLVPKTHQHLLLSWRRRYVAHAENYTLSMTHGFTIKPPAVNTPQYFDLTGSWGRIVYTDDSDKQIMFDP